MVVMQFEFSQNSLDKISADALVVFAFQNEKLKGQFLPLQSFVNLDKKLNNSLTEISKTARFEGKKSETLNIFPQSEILSKWIIVIGLGKKNDLKADTLRRIMGSFSNKMKNKIATVAISIPSIDELNLSSELSAYLIVEGLTLGKYEFSKYKSGEDNNKKELATVIFSGNLTVKEKEAMEKAKDYSLATILARDLVNEQAAIATPTFLADLALDLAKKDPKHISCKVMGRKEIEKLGMEAFLGIAKASETEPKFIHLEYKSEKLSKDKLAIVGKGITFDSGGINVKTGDGMIDMKMDMSGAAIVLGVFSVISKLKPDFNVMGIIAATPNLISGNSLVPGDVVKALNGKTIEILNTDAEGRVTMADSLSYAVKNGATEIIDFATLTGACMVALGTDITGLFSNNKDLADKIKKAAFEAGEKMWELPLEEDYKEINKSEVADIANIPNTRYGGTITAALFLQEFVGDLPWAHMDIAGPAFNSKANDIGPKGGTGHGVRTVLNLLS